MHQAENRSTDEDPQTPGRYELVDFGDGRKLESIAGRLIDRPSPAAIDAVKSQPKLWKQALSRFDAQQRRWHHRTPWPPTQTLDCDGFRMPCQPTPYGHIGVFPEQQDNWKWMASTSCGRARPSIEQQPAPELEDHAFQALNLFAYTGASTIALAGAGYRVAHVDASKPSVLAAKRAAAINGFPDHPIRYLVDDAAKFAAREVRRGRTYQVIVLDPPAYGHGPGGHAWRIERDLWPLLEDALRLADPTGHRLLVTGHSPEVTCNDIRDFLMRRRYSAGMIQSGRSQLKTNSGRGLDAGFFVRVTFDGGTSSE